MAIPPFEGKAQFYQNKVQAVTCPDYQRITNWCEQCTDKPGWRGSKDGTYTEIQSRFRTRSRADPVIRFQNCVEISGGDILKITVKPNEVKNGPDPVPVKFCLDPAVTSKRYIKFFPPYGITIEDFTMPPSVGCHIIYLNLPEGLIGLIEIPLTVNGLNGSFTITITNLYLPYTPIFTLDPPRVNVTFPTVCDQNNLIDLYVKPIPFASFEVHISTSPPGITLTPELIFLEYGQIKPIPLSLSIQKAGLYTVSLKYQSINYEPEYRGTVKVPFEVFPLMQPPTLKQSIINPLAGNYNNHYGQSISCTCRGEYIFIGSPVVSLTQYLFLGAIYVYKRKGTDWDLIQTIYPPLSDFPITSQILVLPYYLKLHEQRALFGSQVACSIDGEILVSSAPGDALSWPGGGTFGAPAYYGGIYTYQKNGDEWTLVPTLKIESPVSAINGRFGTTLALTEDAEFLVGGLPYADITDFYSPMNGQIYVFKRSGLTWTSAYTFMDSGTFGWALNFSYNKKFLAVTAPNYSNTPTGVGSVVIFDNIKSADTGTAEIVQTIGPDIALPKTGFGMACNFSKDATYFYVSAVKTPSDSSSGCIYIYQNQSTANWVKQTIILNPDSGGCFGWPITTSLDNRYIFTAATGFLNSNSTEDRLCNMSGKVYTIENTDDAYNIVSTVTGGDDVNLFGAALMNTYDNEFLIIADQLGDQLVGTFQIYKSHK